MRNSLSKQEILDAALTVLQDGGVENLSMRTIARQINCSVASPYAYFKNRDEIIKHLIEHGETTLTFDLNKARKISDNVYEQLEAITYTYWEFALANRELHKLMLNILWGEKKKKDHLRTPKSYRVFLKTLRYGIDSGQISYSREQYRSIARTMWAWMYGLVMLELTGMLEGKKHSNAIEEGIKFFRNLKH